MAIQFNLLPWREEVRAKKLRNTQLTLLLAALLGVLFSVGYYAWEKTRLDDHAKALGLLQAKNQSLIKELKEKQTLEALKARLNSQVDAIEVLQADRASVSHMVEELSNANTQALFLNEFVLKNGEVKISGVAQNDSQIADLMKKLRESVWYQEPALVRIVSNEQLGEEIKNFIITSQLLLPGALRQQSSTADE